MIDWFWFDSQSTFLPGFGQMTQLMRSWYLSHRLPAKAQANLRISAVLPEHLLFAHMKYGSRRRANQTSSPTGWLRMHVWRMSLRRMKSTIISWHGSFVRFLPGLGRLLNSNPSQLCNKSSRQLAFFFFSKSQWVAAEARSSPLKLLGINFGVTSYCNSMPIGGRMI